MLKRVNGPVDPAGAVVTAAEAAYPVPFRSQLEFNPPVHGTWNIVHMGMQVPESQQIYVCAANCMRGVVLTAAEMNLADRFSFVIVEEQDLVEGTVEDVTIEGVSDVLRKLPRLPRAVFLFTVCLHHFLGCDIARIYRELEQRFPQVDFARCYMDPIMRKSGLAPDPKLRVSMLQLLGQKPVAEKTMALLGGDFPMKDDCDLAQIAAENGWKLRQLSDCGTYSDFLNLAEAGLFLSAYPNGRPGVELAAERLGREFLYLPMCFGYEEITRSLNRLTDAIDAPAVDTAAEIAACEDTLTRAKQVIGDTAIAVDCTVHPRPLGLTRLLLEHGFRVDTVYLDAVSPEEQADFGWLKDNAPDLLLKATVHPKARVLPRGREEQVLAIGQKAAWFEQTAHFVNLVQGGGLWGFRGVRRMAELMIEAFETEKDTRDIVPRKGLGCESCI